MTIFLSLRAGNAGGCNVHWKGKFWGRAPRSRRNVSIRRPQLANAAGPGPGGAVLCTARPATAAGQAHRTHPPMDEPTSVAAYHRRCSAHHGTSSLSLLTARAEIPTRRSLEAGAES